MANGINKVILIGNCCADPEVKYTQSGSAITNITLATNEKWKDKNTGQLQEKAEFHRIVFFNRLAEIAGEYLRKGAQVYIDGKLQTRKWQDQSGQDRYTTEIVASEMQMLGSKTEGASGGGDYRPTPSAAGGQRAPIPPQQQAPQQPQNRPAPPPQGQQMGVYNNQAPQQQAQGADAFDSDIPF